VRDGPWRWQIGLKRVSGDRSAIGKSIIRRRVAAPWPRPMPAPVRRLRRRAPHRCGAAHQPLEMVGQVIEAGVDVFKFSRRKDGFASKSACKPATVSVHIIRSRRARPAASAVGMDPRLRIEAVLGPAIILFRIGRRPHLGAAIVVVLFDEIVEPFANRDAGSACCFAGSSNGLRAKASEIPRTARCHRAQNHLRGNVDRPGFSARKRERRARSSVLAPTFPDLL